MTRRPRSIPLAPSRLSLHPSSTFTTLYLFNPNTTTSLAMPVATRSTTRKTRSLTVYPKPSAQESVGKRAGKASSKTASKPNSTKSTDSKTKTTHRGATKRSRSAANTEANVASCGTEQDQKAENLVGVPVYMLHSQNERDDLSAS